MRKLMDHVLFEVKPIHATPTTVGLAYESIKAGSAHRKVQAWFVAPPKSTTTVLLFQGLGESLSDWVYPQKELYNQNISSVSFTYGPFSDTLNYTKGSSRLSDVTKDVLALIDTIRQKMPHGNIFLLGHSAGNAVMLQIIKNHKALPIKGIIICNAFSSIRNWSVYHKKFPKLFKFIIPRYYDNVRSIKKTAVPLLLVHSKEDAVNPYFMGVEVFEAAHSPKEMKTFTGYSHNDLLKKGNSAYWEPIIEFLKK